MSTTDNDLLSRSTQMATNDNTTLTTEDRNIIERGDCGLNDNIGARMIRGDRIDADLMRGYEFSKAAEREWLEELEINADMRRREAAWEDAVRRS